MSRTGLLGGTVHSRFSGYPSCQYRNYILHQRGIVSVTDGRKLGELSMSMHCSQESTGAPTVEGHDVESNSGGTMNSHGKWQRHVGAGSGVKPKFRFLPAKDVRRALGVDYGRRHIGVAVSTLGLAPRPLQFIRGGGIVELMRMAQDVVDVALSEQCDSIVVGLPVTHEGSLYKRATDSQQGRRCRNFAHTVLAVSEKHSIGVFLVDERGTSMEAGALLDIVGSRQKPKGRKDSVAAALILSTFFADPGAALRVRLRQ